MRYSLNVPNPKKPRSPCPNCGKEPARSYYKYCSVSCQMKCQYQNYIHNWMAGKIIGLQRLGVASGHIRRYLREKYDNKCWLCSWNMLNSTTGCVPLVADHIDGNWRNNREKNLRLICPNCDSLTSTYAALNKGRGRNNRTISKRTREARVLVSKREQKR